MVIETYHRKRPKKPHQPSMEMNQCNQKEAEQLHAAAAPPASGCYTESHFLIPEGEGGEKSQMQSFMHIKEGFLYEINHDALPLRIPAQLRSIRVAMVCEKTDMNLAVRYPSMESLRAFFNYSSRESHPALDEKFVMGATVAAEVLVRPVPPEIFAEHKSLMTFWLMSSMEAASSFKVHKKGSSCLSEALKGNGWGIRRQVKYLGRHKESEGSDVYIPQNSSSSFVNGIENSQMGLAAACDDGESSGEEVKEEEDEEEEEEEEEEEIKVEETDDNLKRKRYSFRNLSARKPKKAKLEIRKQNKTQKKNHQLKKNKKGRKKSRELLIINPKDRWSAERYKLAEQNLLAVMKAKGATAETPILRPQLRAEARKRIGDTGLLDHLLKHMAGKIAPGGEERFRRRHNPDGAMEYWLEDADLVSIRRDAGVTDPYWVPPAGWKLGDSPTQDPICARELKLLKDDISKIKRSLGLMATKMQLEEEVGMLRREIDEISSKKKQQETITLDSNNCDISQKLDQLAASLESSKRDFGYVHVSVEKYKEQLMTISGFVKEIEGKFEMLTPNVKETAKTGSSLMREKRATAGERETKQQVQGALIAAGEKTLQVAKSHKNGQSAAEEKAAKIERLKSGFRICKPQGSFLWPNMVKDPNYSSSINNNSSNSFLQVQVEVPTPPSVSSSTVPPQLPYGGGGGHHYHQPPPLASIVKPLAEKRALTVTVSTLSKGQNYEDSGDGVNNSTLNLNDVPITLDDNEGMPMLAPNGMPWENGGANDDKTTTSCCPSVCEVGKWLALSNFKSASDASSHG